MKYRVKIGYAALAVTYIAVELSILLGCRPFHHNWQINPDPGSKSKVNRHISLSTHPPPPPAAPRNSDETEC